MTRVRMALPVCVCVLVVCVADYPGQDGWDCSLDISLLAWGCRVVLTHHAAALTINMTSGVPGDAVTMCQDIAANLTAPHTDPKTGSLEVYDGIPFATPHRSIGHMFQFYPLHTWTHDMPDRRDALTSSLDTFIRVNGLQQRNDFYWAGLIVYSALAKRGDAALGNASTWFESSLHTGGETLTPTTMYSEGGNPTLEGGLDPAVGVYAMLFQAFPDDPDKSDEMVLRIFPAMPAKWPDAIFHRLRAEGGLEVSARRSGNVTQWVEVRSNPEEVAAERLSFIIEVGDLSKLGWFSASDNATTVTKVLAARNRVRVANLPAGGTIAFAKHEQTDRGVAPLPLTNASQVNWWGAHPHPAPPPPNMPSGFRMRAGVIGKPGTNSGECSCEGQVKPSGCPAYCALRCLSVLSCRAFSLSPKWKGGMVAQFFNSSATMTDNWTTWERTSGIAAFSGY